MTVTNILFFCNKQKRETLKEKCKKKAERDRMRYQRIEERAKLIYYSDSSAERVGCIFKYNKTFGDKQK